MTADPLVVVPAEREVLTDSSEHRMKPPKAPRTRRRTWKQFGLAFAGLVYLAAVALGTMLLGGVALHTLVPKRHIDMFAVLHNHIVLGVLLGLVVLWLLPPYPWAKQQPSAGAGEPVQSAGETEVGGDSNVTDLGQYRAGSRLTGRRVAEGGATEDVALTTIAQQHQQ